MQHTHAVDAGQLLIATQPGRGGYFDQSVVLLLEHHDQGTVGVCLNILSRLSLSAVAEGFAAQLSPPAALFEGGPVNEEIALALATPATPESPPPGWEPVAGGIGVIDLGFPSELLATSFTNLRVFAGLSGWAPGQLEGELIRGSWFRCAARAEDVFGDPHGLWRRVLRRLGGATGRWSTWVAQPELN